MMTGGTPTTCRKPLNDAFRFVIGIPRSSSISNDGIFQVWSIHFWGYPHDFGNIQMFIAPLETSSFCSTFPPTFRPDAGDPRANNSVDLGSRELYLLHPNHVGKTMPSTTHLRMGTIPPIYGDLGDGLLMFLPTLLQNMKVPNGSSGGQWWLV